MKTISLLCPLYFCIFFFSSVTHAAILWAGGEDVDFPNGGAICSQSSSVYNRTGYARAAIYACTSTVMGISNVFQGGAVTSAWLSFQLYNNNANSKFLGFTKSGTNSSLWIGSSASSSSKIALWKYDGTTWTELAAETTGSLPAALTKIDMQVINYGSSATVNIYSGGSANPKLTFTGNVLAGAAVSFDSLILRGDFSISFMSEIIVSTTDSRTFSLATHAPNAAGDTNQWTGTYTNIIPTTINDASNISNANAGDVFQANLGNLTTTNFSVLAIKASARMVQTGSGITSAALGVKTNSIVNIPSATTLSTTWGTRETLYSINPVTSSVWSPTEVNALQIHLESAP